MWFSLCLFVSMATGVCFRMVRFCFTLMKLSTLGELCDCTIVFVPVHRGAGPAPRRGGLGQEHVPRDSGGTSPGSSPQGGGNVSTNCLLAKWKLKSGCRLCFPEDRRVRGYSLCICFPHPTAPAGWRWRLSLLKIWIITSFQLGGWKQSPAGHLGEQKQQRRWREDETNCL